MRINYKNETREILTFKYLKILSKKDGRNGFNEKFLNEFLASEDILPFFYLASFNLSGKGSDSVLIYDLIEYIGKRKPSYAIYALLSLIPSKDWIIRSDVAEVLGEFPESQLAFNALAEILLTDGNHMVRSDAAHSLAEFGGKAIKPLKMRFPKENKMVSKIALATSLTRLEEGDYSELIIEASKSKGRVVKYSVIRAAEELEETHGEIFKSFFKINLNLFPHTPMQERIFKYCDLPAPRNLYASQK